MGDLCYVSTRGVAPPLSLSDAMARGLAPDGGLYVPNRLPQVEAGPLAALRGLPTLARVALRGFFAGDRLLPRLGEIADAALDLPAPTTPVEGSADPLYVLELFHGPTAAFKDFGARFLAESLQRLRAPGEPPLTILVATSGDTGGAVAAAFHRRAWARVVVLYPRGLVSPRQEQQLTCWGENVTSLRVDGTFDDCQRLVKEAFVDPLLSCRHRFSSANSINIGRLLPQMVYYVASSLEIHAQTGQPANFVIPAGNLGNGFAAVWARAIGMPIDRIVLAHNANRTVPDYLRTGEWRPRPSVRTLATAMDVGNPSNMERLRTLYPTWQQLRGQITAHAVDDAAICERIRAGHRLFGRAWCPHTATAAEVYERLPVAERAGRPWVLVATAHPAKFNEVVEPLLGTAVEVPESLARLLSLPRQLTDVAPRLDSVAAAIE
ncbi:MAG TPA: threonine synthase [Steroidobacteraceae bacterium]|nr:threonine synthase [Steroidobacteraceae bacterium]